MSILNRIPIAVSNTKYCRSSSLLYWSQLAPERSTLFIAVLDRSQRSFLAWMGRRMPTERQHVLPLTIVAGGLCGLAAVAFHISIGLLQTILIEPATRAPGNWWIFWTILIPGLGGLVIGLALYFLVPSAAGSGIPQVKAAFTFSNGFIPVKETMPSSFSAWGSSGRAHHSASWGRRSTSARAWQAPWRARPDSPPRTSAA